MDITRMDRWMHGYISRMDRWMHGYISRMDRWMHGYNIVLSRIMSIMDLQDNFLPNPGVRQT